MSSQAAKKILVTGATGLIGRHLCRSLLDEGHTVVGLSRTPEKARDLPRSKRPPQPAELRLQSHALAKEPPKAERTALWRTQMSTEDREEYERIAGPLLSEFGYPTGEEAARAAAEAPAGLEAAAR